MPLFEYQCSQCGKSFEKLILNITSSATNITCPACSSSQVHKKISIFASKTTTGNSLSLDSASPSCSPGGT